MPTLAARKLSPVDDSDIKAEENHVAISHDIILSFNSKLARFARLRERAERNEVIITNCFGCDKTALEIGMNNSGGN